MKISRENVDKVREIRHHASEYMKTCMHAKEVEHHTIKERGPSWTVDVDQALAQEKELVEARQKEKDSRDIRRVEVGVEKMDPDDKFQTSRLATGDFVRVVAPPLD